MRQVWLPYVDCLVCLVCLMLVGHGHGHELFHTDGAWAVLEDGGVTTWGDPARGGDSSAVEEELTSGVVRVFATMGAFSALKSDGSVISWGKASEGGSSSNLHRVVKLAASAHAFAALREDGSVTFWGSIGNELSFDELNQEQSRSNHFLYLQPKVMPQEDLMHLIADVVDVVASTDSFACLKQDGTIYEWDGDVLDKVCDSAGSSIHQLVGGYFSFAALRSDGSVCTWGHSEFGGSPHGVAQDLQNGVLKLEQRSIFDRGFVAWKANATAVIWGHNPKGVPLESQVVHAREVQLRHRAGVVLRTNGSAFSFGDPKTFGDSSGIDLTNIKQILCPRFTCVAVKADGSIVSWGQELPGRPVPDLEDVSEIFGTPHSFAALIGDHDHQRIIAWGDDKKGGAIDYPKKFPHSFGVKKVYSHCEGSRNGVFMAVGDGGMLHAWGDARYGALIPEVIRRLQSSNQTATSTSTSTTTFTTSSETSTSTTSSSATSSSTTSSSVTGSSTSVSVTSTTTSSATISTSLTTSTSATTTATTTLSSTSSTATKTTSTSSSVTTSVTSSTTNTVTKTSLTSSSTTSTISTSTSVTQSSTTTSTTLLLSLELPSNVEADEPEGSVILASLQGALAALASDKESIVVETEAGEVTVVKLSTSTSNSALVFQFPTAGDNESSAIAVSVPVSLVQQLQLEGNVMLSVTQVNEEVKVGLGDGGDGDAKVIITAPVIDFSLIQEKSGAVQTANVSELTDPIVFRLMDASPVEGDVCVFFDLDTNSWSTKGVTLATSAQVAAVSGVNSSGTWCAATHLSLFSAAQTVPLETRIQQKDYLINEEDYMIAVILMVVFCLPICTMLCTWSFFRVQAPASGKTKIKDARGKSHVVKFTRNTIMADRMPSEKTPKNDDKQKQKVLVTWNVEPEEMLQNIEHMKGHGWVDMDTGGGRVAPTKSIPQPMRSMTKEMTSVSEELRKASQEGDRLDEERLAAEEEDPDLFYDGELVEADLSLSPEGFSKESSRELYEDHEPVNYWSTTHQTLMQAFIAGSSISEDEEPSFNVMVGPKKQFRERVPCQYLSAALQDGDAVFYYEGGGKTRIWRKAIVVESIHARGMTRLLDISELEGDSDPSKESTKDGAKSGESAHKKVPIGRICRRFETGQNVQVYQGPDAGWQSAVVAQVEDFTDEFSPLDVKSIQVHLASETDPVDIQTYFVKFPKAAGGESRVGI